jgi:hypothetical protein
MLAFKPPRGSLPSSAGCILDDCKVAQLGFTFCFFYSIPKINIFG